MSQSYHETNKPVNDVLWPEPSKADLRRHGDTLPLRVSDVDFEPYRDIIETRLNEYLDQEEAKKVLIQKRKVNGQVELGEWDEPTDPSIVIPKHLRDRRRTGRPPIDPVLMFRIVFLGVLTRLSDQALAFHIVDNRSFRIFLGVDPGFYVSRQVIWKYRNIFVKSKACKEIFERHVTKLRESKLLSEDGPMVVDGSFVEARIQRNSPETNKKIKMGLDPIWIWFNENVRRQKDADASWTEKGGVKHFGYKLHVLVDADSKLIIYGSTTTARTHDSQALEGLLSYDDKGRQLYADSAYVGRRLEEVTDDFGVIRQFCERGYRNHPITTIQKLNNKTKAKTRSRVEHVFAFIEMSMGGSFVRSVGFERAEGYQWLTMLAYNICRQEILRR